MESMRNLTSMGEAIHLYKVRLGRAHNGGIGNELVDAAVANRAAIGSEARDMTVPLVPTTSAPSYTNDTCTCVATQTHRCKGLSALPPLGF